jgi:hypothetical protein
MSAKPSAGSHDTGVDLTTSSNGTGSSSVATNAPQDSAVEQDQVSNEYHSILTNLY